MYFSFLLLAKFSSLSKPKLFQKDWLILACVTGRGVWCAGAWALPLLELKLQLVMRRSAYVLGTKLRYLGRASGIQTMSFWLKRVTTSFLPCASSFLMAVRRMRKACEEEERESFSLSPEWTQQYHIRKMSPLIEMALWLGCSPRDGIYTEIWGNSNAQIIKGGMEAQSWVQCWVGHRTVSELHWCCICAWCRDRAGEIGRSALDGMRQL